MRNVHRISVLGLAVSIALAAQSAPAAVSTWDGGNASGNWSMGGVGGNWSSGAAPVSTVTNDLVFTSNTNGQVSNNDIGSPFDVNTLTFNTGMTLSGGQIRFNNDAAVAPSISFASNSVTFNNSLALAADTTLNITAATITFNDQLSGPGKLTYVNNGTGTGTVFKFASSVANTINGFTLGNGTSGKGKATIQIAMDNPFGGANSNLNFNNSGACSITVLGADRVIDSNIANMRADSLTFSGDYSMTWNGSFTVDGGSTRTFTNNLIAGKTLTLAGAKSSVGGVTWTGTGLTVISGEAWDSGNYTIPNGNRYGLVKTGTGTLRLTGANIYTGQTLVQGGTLEFNSVGNIGSTTANALGKPTAGNETIKLGTSTTAATLKYIGTAVGGHVSNRAIDLAGTTGSGTLDASGTGPLAFTGGVTASGAGNKTLTLTGTSLADNLLGGAIVDNSTGNMTSLVKSSTGKWILSGASTFTGATNVSGGTLHVTNLGGLQNTSGLTIGTGATFDFAPGTGSAFTLAPTTGTALTLAGGSTIGLELGGGIALQGTATASTTGLITLNVFGRPGGTPAGTYNLLTTTAPSGGLIPSGGTYNLGALYNVTNFAVGAPTAAANAVSVTTTSVASLPTAYWKGGFTGAANLWAISDGSAASNWVTSFDGSGATGLVPGSDTDVTLSANFASNQGGMALGAHMRIKSLTILDGNPVTLNADGNTLTIADNNAITVNTSAAVTLNAPLAGNGVTLTQQGSGTLTLGGANTFNNGLYVKAGTVVATTSASALGAGGVTLGDTSGNSPASLLVCTTGLIFANPITLAANPSGGTLTIGNTDSGVSTTFSGGVTGANNLIINSNSTTGTITFSTAAINNAGTVTNTGAGTGTTTISGGIGPNVTGIIQSSATSALTIGALNVNAGGTTLTNALGSNKKFTVSGDVTGTGNLILNNNSSFGDGIEFSPGFVVNNAGTITNSGTTGSGTGNIKMRGSVGSNVTGLTQSSTFSEFWVNCPLAVNAGGTTLTNTSGGKPLTVSGTGSLVTGTGNLILNNNSALTNGIAISGSGVINPTGTITNSGSGAGGVTLDAPVGANVTAVIQSSTFSALTVNGGINVNAVGTTLNNTLGTKQLTVSGTGGVNGAGNLVLKNDSALAAGINISGAGVINPAGTITNSGSGPGDATIGAIIGANVTGVIQNSVNSPLILSVANTFTNNGSTTFGLTVKAGSVIAKNSASALGAGGVTLGDTSNSNPASLLVSTNNLTFANPITLATNASAGTLTIGNTGTAISTTFSGGVLGTNNLTINSNATSGTITFSTAAVNNTGTVTNIGSGSGATTISGGIGPSVTGVIQNSATAPLILSTTNTYAGPTTISAGTLKLDTAGTIAASTTINVAGGAFFDVASVAGGFHLAAGQTLKGTGTVSGTMTVDSSAILAPGDSSIGTLNVNNSLTLSGTANFRTAATTVSDHVAGITALTYGGNLKITASDLAGGNQWDLFDFTSQSNTFSNDAVFGTSGDGVNLPTLTGGKTWAFDYTSGVLSITSGSGGGPLVAGSGAWVGATDGKWATNNSASNNWSGGYPSAATHTATFDGTGSGTVELPDSLTIGKLALTGGNYTLGLVATTTDVLTMDNGDNHAEIKAGSGTHIINAKVAGTAAKTLDIITETGGALALNGGIDNPLNATLALSQGGGGSLTATDVTNAGTMSVAGTVSAKAISGGGSTSVSGSLTADSIVQNTLTIGAGGTVTIRETTGGSVNAVPEPGTLVLLIAGAAGLLALARRRKSPA